MNSFKLLLLSAFFTFTLNLFSQTYTMPEENKPHEGTWLQWPHQYEYGLSYRTSLEPTWVAMTQALIQGEKVHIIAYDATEQTRITNVLTTAGISLTNIDFKQYQTNDVWVRDNGPVFVNDATGNQVILDWGFNGWGGKYNYILDNPIPSEVGTSIGIPVVNLNSTMTVEGGAYEIDGKGTLMATRSSIISQSPANSVRNPGMTQAQAEAALAANIGVSKFIWLNGLTGTSDITDMHIDGFVQFANDSTIVTMDSTDLDYWYVSAADITTLYHAANVNNRPYHFVYVPLTQNNVVTTSGTNLGYQGSYCNYYIANTVVLVPNYNDPNDAAANAIIQSLYPGKTVVGIDVRNLYSNGGMVHCVTQQQPLAITTGINNQAEQQLNVEQNFPNPFSTVSTINISLDKEVEVTIEIYNTYGQLVSTLMNSTLAGGKHAITINADKYNNGIYNYVVKINNQLTISKRMVVMK